MPTFQGLLHDEMKALYQVFGTAPDPYCVFGIIIGASSILDTQFYSLLSQEILLHKMSFSVGFNYYVYLWLFKYRKPNTYSLSVISKLIFLVTACSAKAILIMVICRSSLNRLYSESKPVGYNFENHSSNKIAFYWFFKEKTASYNFNFLQ